MNRDRSQLSILNYKLLLIVLLLTILSVSLYSQTRVNSDEELFDNGYYAYQRHDWSQAAIYLFAYIQKAPVAISSNPKQAGDVAKAYEYSLNRVNQAIKEREQLQKEVIRLGGNITTGIRGIELPSPILNKPQPPHGIVGGSIKRCNIYARIAVAQNEASLSNHCGFTGLRWSSDYESHIMWCRQASSDLSSFETTERQKMLNQCAATPPIRQR